MHRLVSPTQADDTQRYAVQQRPQQSSDSQETRLRTRASIVRQLSEILKMKEKPRWVLRATELMMLMDKQDSARVI